MEPVGSCVPEADEILRGEVAQWEDDGGAVPAVEAEGPTDTFEPEAESDDCEEG